LADRRDALSALTGWKSVLLSRSAKLTGPSVRPACHISLRPLSLLPVLAILLTSSLGAQSTPQSAPPPPPAKGKAEAQPPKEEAPAKISPSRLVDEKNLDDYVESLTALLSMRDRATDPFGQLQDPNAKPVVKATAPKTMRRVVQVQATPFSDIVRLIKVTTVMPKDKCFLMGSRTVKQGDTLNLAYHGKSIRVEVTTVNSQQIDFRNLDNSESASVKLNVLPTGMSRGIRKITAPGMTPDRPDVPIDLDPTYTPNDKPQSR